MTAGRPPKTLPPWRISAACWALAAAVLLLSGPFVALLGNRVRGRESTQFSAALLAALLLMGLAWWHIWRRRAGRAQLALESRLSSIAASVPGSIYSFRLDAEGKFSMPYTSPAMTGLCGLNAAELAQDASPLFARIHPEDLGRIEGSIAESARSMSLWRGEFRFLHPERGEIWVEGCSMPQREADGAIVWHGYVQDISARRASDLALRAAEERYRTLLDNIPGAAFRSQMGPPAHIVFLSDGAEAITGYPVAELLRPGGIRWGRDVLLAEDRPLIRKAVQGSIASGEPYEVEYRIRHADGGIRWLHEKGRAIRGGEGESGWVDGVIIDISARIEAETALHRSLVRQEGLHELDRAVLEASSPEEVASKGLAHLAALLGFEYGTVRVFDFEAGTAALIASLDDTVGSDDQRQFLTLADFGAADVEFLRKGRVCVAADLDGLNGLSASLAAVRAMGLRAYVRLPMMAEGRLIGSLNLASRQAGHFGCGEVEIVRPVADVLAIALQQALLRQHLAQQAAGLEIRVMERTAELARMKDKAEAASRAKSQFLANMAHELRTPLNSLLVLSQLLADSAHSNLTAEQIGFARIIHDAGSDLLCIINDILDLSKIEAGKAVVRPEELPLPEICAQVERLFQPQAANKGLRLEVAADPDAPARLLSDPNHLHPIVRNLVGNAIKFTPAGSVRLRVRLARSGWSPEHPVLSAAPAVLAFEVSDTGIGIAADKFSVIFEAFEQVDSSAVRRFGGTGLGLHIARSNAALLGGEIQVRSSPGEGSVFTLFLPQRYAGPAHLRPDNLRTGDTGARGNLLSGRRILVAEPDLRSRISTGALLRQHGLEVLTAGSGGEILELLATTTGIDALVMDTGLPDMSGEEVLRRLRGRHRLPVIALGRGRLVDEPERYLAAGCDTCLQKPVPAPELVEVLRASLKTLSADAVAAQA